MRKGGKNVMIDGMDDEKKLFTVEILFEIVLHRVAWTV